MSDTLSSIESWASTLPGLETNPPYATFKYERDGVRSYTLASGDDRFRFKHYMDRPDMRQSILRRGPREASEAEATALEMYAGEGLAPELVWSGEMPPELGGYGIIYRRVEGVTADAADLTGANAEELGRALYQVHSHTLDAKLLSPRPRNLAGWWNRVHEQYRDLPPEFIAALPPALEEALVGLVQSVSGDANAHIRFWQGASSVPVHGNLTMRNVIVGEQQVTLVDWSNFGLGDPAYELASTVWEMALSGHESLAEDLAGPYLRETGEIMVERRVLIYRRLLPFGRFLDFLHRYRQADASVAAEVEASGRYLAAAMMVYGWPQQTIDEAVRQFASWLTSAQQSEPTG